MFQRRAFSMILFTPFLSYHSYNISIIFYILFTKEISSCKDKFRPTFYTTMIKMAWHNAIWFENHPSFLPFQVVGIQISRQAMTKLPVTTVFPAYQLKSFHHFNQILSQRTPLSFPFIIFHLSRFFPPWKIGNTSKDLLAEKRSFQYPQTFITFSITRKLIQDGDILTNQLTN